MVRILFLGDVFGNAGLDAVERHVPALRDELDLDLVLANGENVAGGAGITARLGTRLLAAGIDCLTLGNHTWRRDGTGAYLATAERVVRPANYLRTLPGRGMLTVPARDGTPVTVLNLLGRLTLEPACSPFEIVDRLVTEALEASPVLIVDVHAEATSEKVAMGWHLAGRATAVLGTHTHVQTNDARVLPGGTAYVTDLGMTGPARLRDRGQEGAHPAPLPAPAAGPQRARRRGRAAGGRAAGVRRGGPRDVGRALPALRLSGPGGACALSYPVSMTARATARRMMALPAGSLGVRA